MKVVSSADWRRSIPFETPMLVADLVPGEPTRCFSCGPTSEARERSELWAFKHRHPNHHDGFVRFYCSEHVPAAKVVEVAPPPPRARARRSAATTEDRVAAPRRPAATDAPIRAMCPNCFVEVSATGECGMCGAKVA
ncbi:hypothetical protein FBY39_2015 [Microbacterium sp. SLBN-146]|nr:hypothetical protein FBY39_2015 [Microbacterium sp. SLBN-146]